MKEVPQLLTLAGMSWREADPKDLAYVVSSWCTSARRQFLIGRCQPFKTLCHAVERARADKDIKVLGRIYDNQIRPSIIQALNAGPTLIVYDIETPSYIAAWRNREWAYTKLIHRGLGLQRELKAALG